MGPDDKALQKAKGQGKHKSYRCIEVEGRGGVLYGVDAPDSFIEAALLLQIFDDDLGI